MVTLNQIVRRWCCVSWCLPGAALLKRGCRSWREWERGDSAPEPPSETETGRTLRMLPDPCRTDTAGGRDDTRSLPSSGPTYKQPPEDMLLVTTSVPWCFSTEDAQVKSSGQVKTIMKLWQKFDILHWYYNWKSHNHDIKKSKLWLKTVVLIESRYFNLVNVLISIFIS